MTRILVVDDDPQILRAMRINLRARHYDVAVAADGTTALRDAAKLRPDLVVLDLGLPDIDGVEVIHRLRGWTQVPIIVLSGRTGSQDKVEALDAGADDYVTKPFSIDELIARIRAVTRRAPQPNPAHRPHRRPRRRPRRQDPIPRCRTSRRSAQNPRAEVRLTPTEWHLLEMLVRPRSQGRAASVQHRATECLDHCTSRPYRAEQAHCAQSPSAVTSA